MTQHANNSGGLVGHQALSFALADADGKVYSLQDYAGDWLLMVFHRHLG